MDALYQKIKAIETAVPEQKIMHLQQGIDEAFNYLIEDCENLITTAAESGHNEAYLRMFKKTFKIKDTINLDVLLSPSEKLIDDLEHYEIESLERRLVQHFAPFQVELLDYEYAYVLVVKWD